MNVPDGNRCSSHVYALGVQIYRWSGTSWVFVAPDATLFADSCHDRPVGIHYAGPTWEANDGSKVVGARQADCTPFRNAIPWLRLRATLTSGHGEFTRVTYIQRVNTSAAPLRPRRALSSAMKRTCPTPPSITSTARQKISSSLEAERLI